MSHQIKNQEPELVPADSGQLLWEFAAGSSEPGGDDPFARWLRDGKSVRIDWSTFGIEKLQSEPPR